MPSRKQDGSDSRRVFDQSGLELHPSLDGTETQIAAIRLSKGHREYFLEVSDWPTSIKAVSKTKPQCTMRGALRKATMRALRDALNEVLGD